jgi:hypothetical protein
MFVLLGSLGELILIVLSRCENVLRGQIILGLKWAWGNSDLSFCFLFDVVWWLEDSLLVVVGLVEVAGTCSCRAFDAFLVWAWLCIWPVRWRIQLAVVGYVVSTLRRRRELYWYGLM